MTSGSTWTQAGAAVAAEHLFLAAYPLNNAFDQINPAQDELVRNVLSSSVSEILDLHDDYHDNVFDPQRGVRNDDVVGAVHSTYLRNFYADIKDRVRDGEPFTTIRARFGPQARSYIALRVSGEAATVIMLEDVTTEAILHPYLDSLTAAAIDPVAIGARHSLRATLVAITEQPFPHPSVDFAAALDEDAVAVLRSRVDDAAFDALELDWFASSSTRQLVAMEHIGLLDDLSDREKETFRTLADDWTGTLGDLRRAARNLTSN